MPKVGRVAVTFWKAAAGYKGCLCVAATQDKLVADEVAHSNWLAFDKGEWRTAGSASWSTVALCALKQPSDRLVGISEDGDVMTYLGGGKSTTETIAPTARGLAALTTIDGRAFACGMRRQVFVRTGDGKWKDISAPKPTGKGIAGFEAIAGRNERDLVAVGWEGEIWRRKNTKWTKAKSPVDVILTGVCYAEDGTVYACGQNGTLVVGRGDAWKLLKHTLPKVDLWDIHAFEGSVYAASYTGLLRIDSDRVEPVKLGRKAPSCHRLTSADGVLWSVGAEDIFSSDGKKWARAV